jgi:hypothetical protein
MYNKATGIAIRLPTQRSLRGAFAMMAVAAALAAPASSYALDPALVPSIGADTGRFTLPIICGIKLSGLKVAQIRGTVDIEGIAPVQLGPGQEFYLSQGKGALTLPGWLSALGGIVAVKKADAIVDSLMIGATRSTPAAVDLAKLYDLSVYDVPVDAGKAITVGLPKTGDFRVGPYKAPADGRVQFRFEGATANVTLKTPGGFKLKVRAECVADKGNALLSVAVGPQIDPSKPSLWEGEPLNYPPVAAGNLIGIVTSPYNCRMNGKNYDVGIAVGGILPLAVKKAGSISITEASGALIVPKETVNRMLDEGINTIKGNVQELRLFVENGTPANPNVLPNGTPIPETTLVRDQRIVMSLPTTGTVTAGPIKPTGTKSVVIGMDTAAATFEFNNDGKQIKATCARPAPDALLVDAPVI